LIKDEFDAFLECGILALGFLRLRCGDCGHEKLVAFSCTEPANRPQLGGVNAHGFSVHAAVRCSAHQRKELERLCRYITRPAIANERLKRNRVGQVVLQLKSPWRDGCMHIVMSPLELMQRLAALVPRPRLHLIRFHGVLALHAKLRAQIDPSAPLYANQACDHHAQTSPASPARMSWACLLKRVFDIDVEHCANCGGRLKIIAAIVDPAVITKPSPICTCPRAPPRSPARRVDLFQAA